MGAPFLLSARRKEQVLLAFVLVILGAMRARRRREKSGEPSRFGRGKERGRARLTLGTAMARGGRSWRVTSLYFGMFKNH